MWDRIYEKTYTMTFWDADPYGRIRSGVLSNVMQDAATAHAERLGLGKPEERVVWAMTHMRTVLHQPIYGEQPLHIKTWCCGTKGPLWLRDFSLETPEGEVLGQASTSWVLLDLEKETVLRPSSVIENADDYVLPGHDPAAPTQRFRLKQPVECGKHWVNYCDLDRNQHMNNARIADLMGVALALQNRPGEYVQDLQLVYRAQSRCGEELTLLQEPQTDGRILLQGRTAGEIKFEACAVLAPID